MIIRSGTCSCVPERLAQHGHKRSGRKSCLTAQICKIRLTPGRLELLNPVADMISGNSFGKAARTASFHRSFKENVSCEVSVLELFPGDEMVKMIFLDIMYQKCSDQFWPPRSCRMRQYTAEKRWQLTEYSIGLLPNVC